MNDFVVTRVIVTRAPFSSPNSHHRGWHPAYTTYMQTEISKRISISRVYMRFIKYTNLHQKCKRDLNKIFSHQIKNRKVSSKLSKLFENCLKCRILIFQFWHLPPIFVLLKLTYLVTLFDRKLQVTIFGIFNKVFSTQNVNVASFARNVEWDFFCDFQTLCSLLL